MRYTRADIRECYRSLGVARGRTILLKTDLRFLGPYASADQRAALQAHFDVLAELIDLSEGTLVVATGSLSLCNTATVFDPATTPSEMGSLTEFIRMQPGAIRSFHPFASYAAIGKHAAWLCTNTSRHSFGAASPKERLLGMDTLYMSLGLPPQETCSLIHHIEMIMGVPYRYSKEFIQPVKRNGQIVPEPFYMNVWYRQCDIKRNIERKVIANYYKCGYDFVTAPLGRGKVWSYSMTDFYNATIPLFANDLYAWLEHEPAVRPYQN